jgi:radical SAM protein with 4Fe4S-binding SPASM domain
MVEEMADIGAGDLYLTGGEPLLRQDLLNIMGVAKSLGVRTHVVTKYPVENDLAERLRAAGLTGITISLDDARPHVAAALAGAPNYLDEVIVAIAAILQAGIPLKVNAVVSSVNQNELDHLADLMVQLQVPELSISPFVSPQVTRSNTLQLAPPAGLFVQRCRELQQRYEGQLKVHVGGSQIPDDSGSNRACGRHVDCDVGIGALDVLPDGRVTRCRYMPHEAALIVGDLKVESIMEIWEGDALRHYQRPQRDSYAGASCHDCSGFESCNSRGRCYFTALANHGTLYAPDVFCNLQ